MFVAHCGGTGGWGNNTPSISGGTLYSGTWTSQSTYINWIVEVTSDTVVISGGWKNNTNYNYVFAYEAWL